MGEILKNVRGKFPALAESGLDSSTITEERLLWALWFVLLRKGSMLLETGKKDEIYSGAEGTNYGTEYEDNDVDDSYACYSFAGYFSVIEGYNATFADFCVLPRKNRFLLTWIR